MKNNNWAVEIWEKISVKRASKSLRRFLLHDFLIALLIAQLAIPAPQLYAGDPIDGEEPTSENGKPSGEDGTGEGDPTNPPDGIGDSESPAVLSPVPTGLGFTPGPVGSPNAEINPLAPVESEFTQFLNQLESSSETDAIPPVLDTHELKEQRHDVYETTEVDGEWVTSKVSSVRLGQSNAANPAVPVANFDSEISLVVDRENGELRFERWVLHKGAKKKVLTNAHVFENVELTVAEGAKTQFLRDPNVLTYASTEGVESIFVPVLKDLIFQASVPVVGVLPAAAKVLPGASITSLEYLSSESQPSELFSSENGAEQTNFDVYDIRVTVTLPSGETVPVLLKYKSQLMTQVAASMLFFGLEVQTVNGDFELENSIQQAAGVSDTFKATLEAARTRALQGSGSIDVTEHALVQVGRQMDMPALFELLLPHQGSNNAFDDLISSPGVNIQTGEQWESLNDRSNRIATLTSEVESAHGLEAGTLSQSWREVMKGAAESPDIPTRESLDEIAKIKAEQVNNKAAGILSGVRSYLTPAKIAALVGVIGVDTANYLSGDARFTRWAVSAMSRMFSWTEHVPFIDNLANVVGKNADYFHSTYALTTVLLSLGLVLSFRPLSYFSAQTASRIMGERNEDGSVWSKKKAFFSLGLRAYGWGNFPIQRIFWKGLFRQHNLYDAIQNGVSYTDSRAYNIPIPLPWYNKEQGLHIRTPKKDAEARRAALNSEIDNQAIRKQRALLIAAAIVSKHMENEGEPIDPATLMMLLQADDSAQFDKYIRLLQEGGIPEEVWTNLVTQTYHQLAKLSDGGVSAVSDLDEPTIAKYVKKINKVAVKFNRGQRKGKGLAGCISGACKIVTSRANSFKSWTSQKAIPFLFFGAAQYNVWFKYRNATIDSRNADTAAHQYDEDYDFSAYFYAVADPGNFGKMAMLKVAAVAEVVANQLEQVFIYGVQGGIDNVEVNRIRGSLYDMSPPLSRELVDRGDSQSAGREQTAGEGLRAIGYAMVNPSERRSLGATHLTRMENTASGFQVRMLAGLIPRALGLTAIALAAQKGFGAIPEEMQGALLKQGNVMFNKLAVIFEAGVGLTMGYAAIWAAIIFMQNVIKDRAEEGKTQLQGIDYWVDEAVRGQDMEMMSKAVNELQLMYGKNLPDEYSRAAEDFDLELAQSFAKYSQNNPPVATVASTSIQKWANRAGALVSTILFVSLSNRMYNPEASIVPQLVSSLTFFGATYLGVRFVLIPAGNTILKTIKGCAQGVASWANSGSNPSLPKP